MNKQYRLKRNEEIQRLVAKRQQVRGRLLIVYYQRNQGQARIAVTASKKYGNAVERNYFKRVIRHLIRPYLNRLVGYDLLVVAKTEAKASSFREKQSELNYLLNKMLRKEPN